MVKSNVAGEPLEDLWKLVERTALERRGGIVPIFAAFPVNAFKLMLHVEQPYSHAAGDGHDKQLNQDVGLEAENGAEANRHSQDCQIHPQNRPAFPLIRIGRGEPLSNEEYIKR